MVSLHAVPAVFGCSRPHPYPSVVPFPVLNENGLGLCGLAE